MKNSMPVNNELPYIRVPRVLLSDPRCNHLSADTKLLYSAMVERLALSDANGWYDILNKTTYFSLEGKLRFFVGKNRYFDFVYQKGSGAPNFNKGDQYGINLTVGF